MTAIDALTPWYKQFWPWFIILLPASVVVAGIVTVFIAINHADSLVVDDYYQQGLGINRQLAEDDTAQSLAAAVTGKLDLETGEIRLSLQGNFSNAPATLLVNWIHPTSQAKDFSLRLLRSPLGDYSGQLTESISGRWYLQVSADEPEHWRLKTVITLSTQEDHSLQRISLDAGSDS